MGVDTEIFISYGIVLQCEECVDLDNLILEYGSNFTEELEVSSDGYCTNYSEVCIHLKSQKQVLFDKKTGGNAGRGDKIGKLYEITPSTDEINEFLKFSEFLYRRISENFQYANKNDYTPSNIVYYRNW